jgi:hypothetical protein
MTTMPTLDLKKDFKRLYNPSAKAFTIVDVPPMNFLMIDGEGDPNTAQAYREAIETLYAVAYTLKFTIKKEQGIDYPVMPLEGLWWADDMALFSAEAKGDWRWTMLIMQPDLMTTVLVADGIRRTQAKKELPALSKLKFERFHEGLSAQILYFGAYSAEGPTIARLHEFIAGAGYERSGKHHEIYLGDPRRSAPDKLKTVIRQPMRQV